MGRITLITGGSRGGKSRYALVLGEKVSSERVFIATATAGDDDMRDRIRRHKAEREGRNWRTIEEPLLLHEAIRKSGDAGAIVIDCLTLWVSNLMQCGRGDRDGWEKFNLERMDKSVRLALDAMKDVPGRLYVVTNEIGMGIVPDNALARSFRDLLGYCNQRMAQVADEVLLMVSGIPVAIKGG